MAPASDVIKAYQQFTRVLDERRLTAKNRKTWEGTVPTPSSSTGTPTARGEGLGRGGTPVEVDRIRLLRDGAVEEEIAVGDAQDADNSHPAHVVLEGSDWSSPVESERGLARGLGGAADGSAGSVAFKLYAYFAESSYTVELEARGRGQLRVEVVRGGVVRARLDEELATEWSTHTVTVLAERAQVAAVGAAVSEADYNLPSRPSAAQAATPAAGSNGSGEIRHWPGEGTITIEAIALAGQDGEQAVFHVGTPLTVTLELRSHANGTFPLTPAVVLYRLDGTRVSSHVGPSHELELEAGESRSLRLHFDRLNLGDGHYILSAALYRQLVPLGASETYDLVDRSYEFEVVGNDPLHGGVFHHPAEWILR